MSPKKIALIAVIVLTALIFILIGKRTNSITNSAQRETRAEGKGPCPGKTETLEMGDPYMKGVIEKGQSFKVTYNWYACNPLKVGDIVLYRFSESVDPVPRFVRGIPGDKFKLVKDKEHRAWNVEINGKILEIGGAPHFFGGENPPALSLYEKPRNGILGQNEVLLFANTSPSDEDSGRFGITNINDFLGKIEAPEKTK